MKLLDAVACWIMAFLYLELAAATREDIKDPEHMGAYGTVESPARERSILIGWECIKVTRDGKIVGCVEKAKD